MSRPDAAKIIGENLHHLVGADGKPRRLMQYSMAGHSPEHQNHISGRALDIGECIVHLLEKNGYSLTHRGDPEPAEADSKFPIAEANCAHCGEIVLRLAHLKRNPNRPDRWTSKLHKSTLEAMGHSHKCWER